MFKDRNNINKIGNITGTVISTSPFKLSIFDGQVILKEDHLFILDSLLSGYVRNCTLSELDLRIEDDNGNTITEKAITSFKGKIELTDTLEKGDKLLLMSSDDEQVFYILGKVRKL